MNEIQLKYGCNPNQKPSRIYMEDGSELPVSVLNGKPGYINFLDALNGWQLVKELKEATGLRWDCLCRIRWQRFTGWMIWVSFLLWHVPMRGPEARTVCLPSAISFPFPMYVMQIPPD